MTTHRRRYIYAAILVTSVSVAGLLYALSGNRLTIFPRTEFAECTDCNLIIISLSNVGANHMSLYGYDRETTPRLQKWARNAVVFDNAFVQTSWTLPVGTSIFTSLYPFSHGIIDRPDEVLKHEDITTLPEILRARGYATAAFTGGLDYKAGNTHMRGFDIVDEAVADGAPDFIAGQKGMTASLQRALAWIKLHADGRFFLFTHGYDAHCPFVPPTQLRGTFTRDIQGTVNVDTTYCYRGYENTSDGSTIANFRRVEQGPEGMRGRSNVPWESVHLTTSDIAYLTASYDEAVLSVDAIVTDFLESIPPEVAEKTIIVIYSDHGEMFAHNGRFGRAGTIRHTFYDDVVHVPLIVRAPELPAKRVGGIVQLIDLMPTVLHMLGIKDTFAHQGVDLEPLIFRDTPVNEYAYAGSNFNAGEHTAPYLPRSTAESVRSTDWKLIKETLFEPTSTSYELYDLKNDPDELHNVIDKNVDMAENLKHVLSTWDTYVKNY